MEYIKTGTALFMTFVLAGCANTPLPPTSKVVSTTDIKPTDHGEATVDVIYQLKTETNQPTDSNLRLVTRGDTAAVVGLKTLKFMATFLVGGASETGFSKDQLKGTAITSESNPATSYMASQIKDKLSDGMQRKAPLIYKNHVEVYAYDWYLVYENLSGGENYELRYKTEINKVAEDGKSTVSVLCEPKAVKAPLTQWQANNYQKVNEVTKTYMDTCLKDMDQKLDRYLL